MFPCGPACHYPPSKSNPFPVEGSAIIGKPVFSCNSYVRYRVYYRLHLCLCPPVSSNYLAISLYRYIFHLRYSEFHSEFSSNSLEGDNLVCV